MAEPTGGRGEAEHGRPAGRPRPRRPRSTPRPPSRRPTPPAAETAAPAEAPAAEARRTGRSVGRRRASAPAAADSAAARRRPRATAPRLVRDRRDRQQEPAAQAADRACRPVAVEGTIVTLGFPEEQAFLQRGRRAQARGHRGRHRRVPRPPGRRPLRRDATSTCCRRSPTTATRRTSSPRPSGSSPRTWPTSARSPDRPRPAVHARRASARLGAARPAITAPPTEEPHPWAWATCSAWRSRCSRRWLRVQAELETLTVDGSAGGGVVKATVTGKQELVSVDDRPVGGRPRRRRDAPGPRRQRRQRGAPRVAGARRQKMAAVTGGLKIPGLG